MSNQCGRGRGRGGRHGGRPPPLPYQGATTPASFDTDQALNEVDQHASRILPRGTPANQQTITAAKYHDGLRTAFAAVSPPQSRHVTVATNFLNLTIPPNIWVYEIVMYHDNTTNPRNPVMVKGKAARDALMTLISPLIPELANNVNWVSDSDLLWSTTHLWNNNGPPDPHAVMATLMHDPNNLNPDLTFTTECGERVTIDQIDILFDQLITFPHPGGMTGLLTVSSDVAFSRTTPGILQRGLNAMLSSRAHQKPHLTFKGGNKFFDVSTFRGLGPQLHALSGFFLSARPGIDRLLVNINVATSPFWRTMTLDQYFTHNRGITASRARAALRGLKVRIRYNVAGGWNPPEARYRFIYGFERGPNNNPQPTTISHQNCQQHPFQQVRIANWFSAAAGPAARADPLYPTNLAQFYPGNAHSLPRHDIAVKVALDRKQIQTTWEWFPASLLEIVEYQPLKGEMGSADTSAMIGIARAAPAQNAASIMTSGLAMFDLQTNLPPGQLQNGQSAHLARYNPAMAVGNQMLQVPGVVLQAPQVQYRNLHGVIILPRVGDAAWNLMRVMFMTTRFVTSLPVFDFNGPNQSLLPTVLRNLDEKLQEHGVLPNTGVAVPHVAQYNAFGGANPTWTSHPTNGAGQLQHNQACETALTNVLQRVPAQSRLSSPALIYIQRKDYDLYAYIKRVADLKLGLHTITMTNDAACGNRFNPLQAASNLSLKYNLKNTAGVNHQLHSDDFDPIRNVPTIVIGADVTHPGSGARDGTPSVAAVVGTIDRGFMRFPGSMRLQRARKEEIVELGDMVKERLIDFAAENSWMLPKRMLFYRDGVSETQYDKIRSYEIPQIQKAFNWAREFINFRQRQGTTPLPQQVMDPARNPWPALVPCNPVPIPADPTDDENFEYADNTGLSVPFELTYIVVGKRHNTRFYPLDSADTAQGNGNVRPGLVVDQVITHPYRSDFYLQSHMPIVGTGRSAHYFVLQNDMALSTAHLQKVTHTFCYAYARATKGVSYCAPAYYADRLCDRGRAYLRHWLSKREDTPPGPNQSNRYAYVRRRNVFQNPPETPKAYNTIVKDWLRDQSYWRDANVVQASPRKYGFDRRNPWHPNLDGTMFYL